MKKTAKKVDEGFGDNRISIPTDLSLKKGSASYIIKNNLDAINACKTKEELIDLMNKLFDEGKLDMGHRKDFPWRNKFFYRMNQARDLASAQKIVYDAMLKGQGLGVIYEGEKDAKKDKACESKKQYTKKQITEAIAYWRKQLKKMDESSVIDGIYTTVTFGDINAKVDVEAMWSLDSYEWGIKQSNDALDIFRQWKAQIEKYCKENGFDAEVVSIKGPVYYDNEFNVGFRCNGDVEAFKDFASKDK